MKLQGGCHCGQVRYQVETPDKLVLSECNCSICYKSGMIGLIVPRAQFQLLRGEDQLSTYTFNTSTAQHHFCSNCGVKSFYVPRSHPDGVSVNFRCLDDAATLVHKLSPFNGQEWEQQYPAGRAESCPNALD